VGVGLALCILVAAGMVLWVVLVYYPELVQSR
jgi:hypothetical protein